MATLLEKLLYIENNLIIIGVDTETNGLCPHTSDLLSIQLGDESTQVILYNRDLANIEIRETLHRILFSNNILKVFHNFSFDVKILWANNFQCQHIFDTLLAEKLIYAGHFSPKGFFRLDSVLYRRLGIKFTHSKDLRETFAEMTVNDIFSQEQAQYALEDIKYLPKIKKLQHKVLYNMGMASYDSQDRHTVLGLENNAVFGLASIEYNGFLLNQGEWDKIKIELGEDVDFQREYLNTLAKEIDPDLETEINWNSYKQKLVLLNKVVPELESTAMKALTPYKNKHKIFAELIKYNKINKLYSSFAATLPNHVNSKTGRVHTSFDQIKDTGRVSSFKPNMQQIPSQGPYAPRMRACFIASPGYKIVGGDYSSCELRIIAEYSQDPIWLEVYSRDGDLHGELAAMVFDIPLEDVREYTYFNPDKTYRSVIKTVNFGLAFGMSAYKLSDTIQVSVPEAQAIIDLYFSKVPKVKEFLDKLGEMGAKRGYIKSPPPFGRIRFFDKNEFSGFKRMSQIERQAKNLISQGSPYTALYKFR